MLTQKEIYNVLCQLLPAQNDFTGSNYTEELQELSDFGIRSKINLLDLVIKHRDEALEIDAEPLEKFLVKHYSEEYGKDYVQLRIENKFWYAYPALLRIILQLEFGSAYEAYAAKRDHTG